jgi:hypothetical protein
MPVYLCIFGIFLSVIGYNALQDGKERKRTEASLAMRACDDLIVVGGLTNRLKEIRALELEETIHSVKMWATETPGERAFRKAQFKMMEESLFKQDFIDNAAYWECRRRVSKLYPVMGAR